MATIADVEAKFQKLIDEGQTGAIAHKTNFEQRRRWAMSSLALIRAVFGQDGEHFKEASRYIPQVGGQETSFLAFRGILQSALDSWREGYVVEVRRLVEADVEADLIGQAQALLDARYDRAAAVVAGAVLERHLRSICGKYAVPETDSKGKGRTLDPINQDLKKAGAYDGLMQQRITTQGALRNQAAHGGDFKATSEDVERMIRDVIDICSRVS